MEMGLKGKVYNTTEREQRIWWCVCMPQDKCVYLCDLKILLAHSVTIWDLSKPDMGYPPFPSPSVSQLSREGENVLWLLSQQTMELWNQWDLDCWWKEHDKDSQWGSQSCNMAKLREDRAREAGETSGSFCLRNFIFPSLFKGDFIRYRILGWCYFFFQTVNALLHSLLVCMVSEENYLILILVLL